MHYKSDFDRPEYKNAAEKIKNMSDAERKNLIKQHQDSRSEKEIVEEILYGNIRLISLDYPGGIEQLKIDYESGKFDR